MVFKDDDGDLDASEYVARLHSPLESLILFLLIEGNIIVRVHRFWCAIAVNTLALPGCPRSPQSEEAGGRRDLGTA